MKDVQHIEYNGPRVETGAVQFGSDWPGLFVRGDNAFYIAMLLDMVEQLLDKVEISDLEQMGLKQLWNLRDTIRENVIIGSDA